MQNRTVLPFTLYLPSGPQPEDGWPIALIGPGATQGQNGTTTNFAATLAAHGIATIGINTVGQGFGTRSKLIVELANGQSVTVPNPAGGSIGMGTVSSSKGTRRLLLAAGPSGSATLTCRR